MTEEPLESTPPESPGVIHSRLAKAAQLALSSTQFQPMVEAACLIENIHYSDEVRRRAAINTALLDALTLYEGSSIDIALINMMADPTTAATLDGLIRNAVKEA